MLVFTDYSPSIEAGGHGALSAAAGGGHVAVLRMLLREGWCSMPGREEVGQ